MKTNSFLFFSMLAVLGLFGVAPVFAKPSEPEYVCPESVQKQLWRLYDDVSRVRSANYPEMTNAEANLMARIQTLLTNSCEETSARRTTL